jgi:hypothetical protein
MAKGHPLQQNHKRAKKGGEAKAPPPFSFLEISLPSPRARNTLTP